MNQNQKPTFTVAGQRPPATRRQAGPDYGARIVTSNKRPPRICIAGGDGVGKTTAACQLPNPIILCAEDGLIGENSSTPAFHPSSWADAIGFVNWLIQTDDLPYKSIAIDVLDWLEAQLFAAVISRANASKQGTPYTSIEDFGYGKGYEIAAERFRELLALLERLQRERGYIVVILAHLEVKTFQNPGGDNYDRYVIKACKQVAALVRGWVDELWCAAVETTIAKERPKATKGKARFGRRIVHTTYAAGWDAKSRNGLPPVLPLDMADLLERLDRANGAGEEPAAMLAEIAELKHFVDPEIHGKIDDAVQGASPAKLAMILNRLRTLAEQVTEEIDEEQSDEEQPGEASPEGNEYGE